MLMLFTFMTCILFDTYYDLSFCRVMEYRLSFVIHLVRGRNCLFWILTILYLITGLRQKTLLNLCALVCALFLENFAFLFIALELMQPCIWSVSRKLLVLYILVYNGEIWHLLFSSSRISYSCLCRVWYHDMVCNQVRCSSILFLH